MKTRMQASLGIFALLFLAIQFMASAQVLSNGMLQVTMVPAGGKIAIVQTNGNVTRDFTLQTKIMTEMAKNTAVTSVTSFIRETHLVSSPAESTFQGVRATTANMFLDVAAEGTSSANATSMMSYSVQVSVFQEDGYIKLGSKRFPVGQGQMAITFSIIDWPFESYDNTLDLRVSIETPSAGGSYNAPELFLFNGASWTFSSIAQIPAPYDSSPVTVSTANTDSGVDVTMRFYASGQITYDTLWSVESATSDAARLTSFLSFLF